MGVGKKKRINAMKRKQTARKVRVFVEVLTSPPLLTLFNRFAYEVVRRGFVFSPPRTAHVVRVWRRLRLNWLKGPRRIDAFLVAAALGTLRR